MNVQFKKGVLELVILLSIAEKDMYGYELVTEVSKVIDVTEGTVYPILKRLTKEQLFDTYLKESNEGPPRKYYKITSRGMEHTSKLREEWIEFHSKVDAFVKKM